MEASERAASFSWIGWYAGAACALGAALAAARLAALQGHGGTPLAATAAALALLLLPYFLFGTTGLASSLAAWMEVRPSRVLVLAALLLLPYPLYASGTDTFSSTSLLKLVGLVMVPLLLLLWARVSGPVPRWQDALAVLAVWLPFDFGWLRDAWPWPEGVAAYTLSSILGVDLVVLLFVSFRRVEGVGYRLTFRRADLPAASWNLLIFLCIGIPIGLSTGFIAFNHSAPDLLRFAGRFIGIFLVTAVPEELLFRGLIQNLLAKVLPATTALLVASLIFGAAHLNNGPYPDWRYFLLASIAGVFYGRAYRRSGGLMAACLVHAAVDTIWGEFFR